MMKTLMKKTFSEETYDFEKPSRTVMQTFNPEPSTPRAPLHPKPLNPTQSWRMHSTPVPGLLSNIHPEPGSSAQGLGGLEGFRVWGV